MPKHYAHLLLVFLSLLLLNGCQDKKTAGRITADNYLTAIPDPKTLGEAYVSDPDSLLQPGTVAALNAQLSGLDQRGRAHIDVVVVQSIGEEVPKTAATALFNQWKIGDKEKNNGLLMLLVMDQRRVEFETGYGLEGDLPDVTCYRIQQQYMVPELKADRTDAAVQAGVDALIQELAGSVPAPVIVPDIPLGPEQVPPAPPVTKELDVEASPEAYQMQPDVSSQGYNEEADRANHLAEPAPSFFSEWGGWLLTLGIPAVVLLLILQTSDPKKKKKRLKNLGVVVAFLVFLSLSIWSLLVLAYVLPLLAMHGYLFYQYQLSQQPRWQRLSRRRQYLRLQRRLHYLGFTAYLFPLVLAWYWPWHRRRMAHLRDDPYTCPDCGQLMHRLDDLAEKPYLTPGEQTEERIESVDYDVWQCPNGHQLQLAYTNPKSRLKPCSVCHYRTLELESSSVVKSATTSREGWGWNSFHCQNCQHEEQQKYTIPRKSRSSSGGSSSSSSSSGSSSHSSSSGGSSGGGGAGSSW